MGVPFWDLEPCEVAGGFPDFGDGGGEVGGHLGGEGGGEVLGGAAEEAEEGAVGGTGRDVGGGRRRMGGRRGAEGVGAGVRGRAREWFVVVGVVVGGGSRGGAMAGMGGKAFPERSVWGRGLVCLGGG